MDFSQFALAPVKKVIPLLQKRHKEVDDYLLSLLTQPSRNDRPKKVMACLFIHIKRLLHDNELFRKPSSYELLSNLYMASKDSGASSVFIIDDPDDENLMIMYYKIGVIMHMHRIDVRGIVHPDRIEKYSITEAKRWILYTVNCLTWFNQQGVTFVNIDNDEKIKRAQKRYKKNKQRLPYNEFALLNAAHFMTELEDCKYIHASTKSITSKGRRVMASGDVCKIPESVPLPELDMKGIEDRMYDLYVWLLNTQSVVGGDVETTGLDVFTDELVSLGIGFDAKIGFYLSFSHREPKNKALHIAEYSFIRYLANLSFKDVPVKNHQKYWNFLGDSNENLSKGYLFDLVDVLKEKETIWHNAKFDYNVLLTATGKRVPIFMDTMLAHYVAVPGYDDPSRDKRGLKIIAQQELGVPSWGIDITKCRYEPKDLAAAYNGRDISYMFAIALNLAGRLRPIWKLFKDVEMRFLPALMHAERNGVGLDIRKLKLIEKDLLIKMKRIKEEFTSYYNGEKEFNINSGPMLKDLFFKQLEIIPVRKCRVCGRRHQEVHEKCVNTECEKYNQPGSAPVAYVTETGDPRLDKYALKELARAGVDQAKDLMEYRAASKLVNSYTNLDKKIHPFDGMLHPSYNQARTATGRLSSSKPNFQQLPKRAGKYIRGCIVPRPKQCLIAADYAGQEIRILAAYSGDIKLIQAYNPCFFCPNNPDHDNQTSQFGKCKHEDRSKGSKCNVVDIHSYITKQIHGDAINVDVSEIKDHPVYDKLRTIAKSVTFALAYGGSAYGIADSNDIPVKEAQDILRKYFDTFPGVGAFINRCQTYVDKQGKITDMVGRTRQFKYAGFMLPDHQEYYGNGFYADGLRVVVKHMRKWVGKDRRAATNFPVQALAATMCKIAAAELYEALIENKLDADIIQFIHDEILLSCAKDSETIKLVVDMIRECMTQRLNMQYYCVTNDNEWTWPPYLSMEVDIAIGDSYGNMVKPEEYLEKLEAMEDTSALGSEERFESLVDLEDNTVV